MPTTSRNCNTGPNCDFSIKPIQLPVAGIEELQAEARQGGFRFLDTLVAEWDSGENRYNGPGETLRGCFHQRQLIGVGGLNRDPFAGDPAVGRIRRVYVRECWRNQGVGGALVRSLLNEARGNFSCVRLRADGPAAARLYERLGFVPILDPHATHVFIF